MPVLAFSGSLFRTPVVFLDSTRYPSKRMNHRTFPDTPPSDLLIAQQLEGVLGIYLEGLLHILGYHITGLRLGSAWSEATYGPVGPDPAIVVTR